MRKEQEGEGGGKVVNCVCFQLLQLPLTLHVIISLPLPPKAPNTDRYG